MTSFTLGTDGMNVQRLKGSNRKPGSASAITAISAVSSLHQSAGVPKTPQQLRLHERVEQRRFIRRRERLQQNFRERRRHKRRRRDRRTQSLPVLLDTRATHERRHSLQRSSDRQLQNKLRRTGIDVVV